ncbi:MAG: MFS transporter [Geminicoccaceae bacterium]
MGLGAAGRGGIIRGPVTWYCYLLLGFFTYILNIQGNIVPFLKDELSLSYAAVSLHSAALAVGMIAVGLFGAWFVARSGRRRAFALGAAGCALGAILLCAAPAAWASILSCGLIGLFGALLASMAPAVLAEKHGPGRDIALAELSATCYAFGILAPLAASAAIVVDVGWRGAVLAGAAIGLVILAAFARTPVPDPPALSRDDASGRLPPAYWVYWCVMALCVSLEFCVLLWSPAFLGSVVGLEAALAAAGAAAFSLAVLLGRLVTTGLVRKVSTGSIYVVAMLIVLAGFAVYWTAHGAVPALGALFLLGIGIAPLYALTAGFCLAAAGRLSTTGSSRLMLAVGTALLIVPPLLGSIADHVGLRSAHLILPVLAVAAMVLFGLGRHLERRAGTASSLPRSAAA